MAVRAARQLIEEVIGGAKTALKAKGLSREPIP